MPPQVALQGITRLFQQRPPSRSSQVGRWNHTSKKSKNRQNHSSITCTAAASICSWKKTGHSGPSDLGLGPWASDSGSSPDSDFGFDGSQSMLSLPHMGDPHNGGTPPLQCPLFLLQPSQTASPLTSPAPPCRLWSFVGSGPLCPWRC